MNLKIKWSRIFAWLRNLINQRHYNRLTIDELYRTKKSDTLFLFGSGYSLHDIPEEEFRLMEKYDTMSFNWFIYQDFLRIDYHMVREIWPYLPDHSQLLTHIRSYASLIVNNPHYNSAVLIVQQGLKATDGNEIVGSRLLPPGNKIFRFYTTARGQCVNLSLSLSEGLSHGSATLIDCLNFAYLMAWRKIVLVGVDLYDRRYFWLGSEETRANDEVRGKTHRERHNTADLRLENDLRQPGR